jgi:hypothetical protein
MVVAMILVAGWTLQEVRRACSRESCIQVSFRAERIAAEERLTLVTREDVVALVPRAAMAYGLEDGIVRDHWGHEVTVDAVQEKGYWHLKFHSPGWDGTEGTDDGIDFVDNHPVGRVSRPAMPAAPAGAP